MRQKEPNIIALCTARKRIELDTQQAFYSTQKAYEIWDICPVSGQALKRLVRIDKKRVLWVLTTESPIQQEAQQCPSTNSGL